MRLIGTIVLTNAERQKRYRERHPDRISTAKGVWALANPEKFREGAHRRDRLYRERHPDKSKIRNAKFRATARGAATYLYYNAKRRARIDGLEFSLTKEWILAAVENGKCQITGLPFTFENGRKPFAPSLDRTNPLMGYTPDNVKIVVWMYNSCKWCFTHEDVVVFARAVVEAETNEIP
jgi:hypothetical protein